MTELERLVFKAAAERTQDGSKNESRHFMQHTGLNRISRADRRSGFSGVVEERQSKCSGMCVESSFMQMRRLEPLLAT